MNTLTILAAIRPIQVGESSLINWLITLVGIAIVFTFVVWLVTKIAGPPSIPEQFRWIVWILVAIALLIFLFAALGISLP